MVWTGPVALLALSPETEDREAHNPAVAVGQKRVRALAGGRVVGKHVETEELAIWTEQVGEGPDVLLIGGLGDTVESWQFQLDGLADRYRLTAFDNRGAGRTLMPEGHLSVEMMADDAAAVLRGLDITSAHVAGFSGGGVIAQELALRHPDLVRSLVL